MAYIFEHVDNVRLQLDNIIEFPLHVPSRMPQSSSTEESIDHQDLAKLSGRINQTERENMIPQNNTLGYFNRFVEELERKYAVQHNTNDDEKSSAVLITSVNDGSTSKGTDDEIVVQNPLIKSSSPAKLKSRKRVLDEFYDDTDDFIDDSDIYGHVNRQLSNMEVEVKLNGFFVSSGALESLIDEKSDKSSSSRASIITKPTRKSSVTVKKDSNDEIHDQEDLVTITEKKSMKRVSTKKEEWTPNEKILEGLENFKACVRKVDCSNLKKSAAFPIVLNSPLYELDSIVKDNFRENMSKYFGYYETIATILGSEMSATKIKNHISKVNTVYTAIELVQKIKNNLNILSKNIKDNIKTIGSVKLGGKDTDVDDSICSIKGLENPKSVVEKSVCQWYCKWTLEMKDLLFETDNLMKLLQQVKKKVLVSSSSNSAAPKTKKKISVATSNSCTSSTEDGIEYNEINNGKLVSAANNVDGNFNDNLSWNSNMYNMSIAMSIDANINILCSLDEKQEQTIMLLKLCEAFPKEGCRGSDLRSLRTILSKERNNRSKNESVDTKKRKKMVNGAESNTGIILSSTSTKGKMPLKGSVFPPVRSFDEDDFIELF